MLHYYCKKYVWVCRKIHLHGLFLVSGPFQWKTVFLVAKREFINNRSEWSAQYVWQLYQEGKLILSLHLKLLLPFPIQTGLQDEYISINKGRIGKTTAIFLKSSLLLVEDYWEPPILNCVSKWGKKKSGKNSLVRNGKYYTHWVWKPLPNF